MVYIKKTKGSILIMSLWVLMLLTIFSIHIGARVRQRILLVSRIEDRSQLRFVTEAGIKKAIEALKSDVENSENKYTEFSKTYRHNNPELFKDIDLDIGATDISYAYDQGLGLEVKTNYGVVDEERKININIADKVVLQNLFENILGAGGKEAAEMATSIIDWREEGDVVLEGFNSDEYYSNLKYPYEKKDAEFSLIDEILLVRGMTVARYEKIKPFITVFGDGQINFNTASFDVLKILGVDEILIEKILQVRSGADGEEFTEDDYIFQRTFDIATELQNFEDLTFEEIKKIDYLNSAKLIKTNSSFYFIESQGRLISANDILTISCVFDSVKNSIIYWIEK